MQKSSISAYMYIFLYAFCNMHLPDMRLMDRQAKVHFYCTMMWKITRR